MHFIYYFTATPSYMPGLNLDMYTMSSSSGGCRTFCRYPPCVDGIQLCNAVDDTLDSTDAAGGGNVLNGAGAAEASGESGGAGAAGGAGGCAGAGGGWHDWGGAGERTRDAAGDAGAVGGAGGCAVAVALEAV